MIAIPRSADSVSGMDGALSSSTRDEAVTDGTFRAGLSAPGNQPSPGPTLGLPATSARSPFNLTLAPLRRQDVPTSTGAQVPRLPSTNTGHSTPALTPRVVTRQPAVTTVPPRRVPGTQGWKQFPTFLFRSPGLRTMTTGWPQRLARALPSNVTRLLSLFARPSRTAHIIRSPSTLPRRPADVKSQPSPLERPSRTAPLATPRPVLARPRQWSAEAPLNPVLPNQVRDLGRTLLAEEAKRMPRPPESSSPLSTESAKERLSKPRELPKDPISKGKKRDPAEGAGIQAYLKALHEPPALPPKPAELVKEMQTPPPPRPAKTA
jgi:hypothetical protein